MQHELVVEQDDECYKVFSLGARQTSAMLCDLCTARNPCASISMYADVVLAAPSAILCRRV